MENNNLIIIKDIKYSFDIENYDFILDKNIYKNHDLQGYLLNGKYQNTINILENYKNNNVIVIDDNNEYITIGYYDKENIIIIEMIKTNDDEVDKLNILHTIDYLNGKTDIPNCVNFIFEKHNVYDIDFLRNIKDYDKIIKN
tara:strand:+ start:617 stop:1042 length:426 start_codon:yes stop_codon:yes gene_type:complete